MKKVLSLILAGLTTVTFACSNLENHEAETINQELVQQEKQINKDVNVNEFSELLSTKKGQVLDVRTPEEWAEGTIDAAIKVNFYDKNFNTEISKLDKTKPVYVYCKSGGRSGKTASQLKTMGFSKIYNLIGGITAWNDAGKPTKE